MSTQIIKTNVVKSLESNLIEYFSNSMTSENLISESIKSELILNPIQEEEITELLKVSNEDWDNAPCDEEGATDEQNKILDSIIDKCVNGVWSVIEKSIVVDKNLFGIHQFNGNYFGICRSSDGLCVLGGDSANSDDYDKEYFELIYRNWDGKLTSEFYIEVLLGWK